MSENNEEQLNDESHASALDVGRRLREARVAKGLALDVVARELRLQEKLIAALEEGRSEDLPPATFVSGYLRNYGRMLGLDTDELVRDYGLEGETPPPLAPNSGTSEVRSSDAPVKVFTYLIILALVGLLVLWWLSRQPEVIAPVAEPELESLTAGESMALSLPPAPSAPATEVVEAPVADVPAETGEVETERTADEVVTATGGSVAAESLVPTVGAELELRINEDSWTEVYDSDGARLAYGLYKAGRELKVQGQAPFKLFFGYAPGVELRMNGTRVDVMRYKRRGNDTARFQLGTADDNLGADTDR